MGPLEIKGIILVAAMGVASLCLWIGYRLYLHGVIEKGRIVAEGGGLKIQAVDYGPGVAFAVLGTCIVIFAITRDMSSTTTQQLTNADGSTHTTFTDSAAAMGPAEDAEYDNAPPDPPVVTLE